MHDNKLINAQNETISWTKYVFQKRVNWESKERINKKSRN